MYGVLVGETTKAIEQGERITTQNVVHRSESYRMSEGEFSWSAPQTESWNDRTFMATIGLMDPLELPTSGWSSPWSFAKTVILKPLKSSMLKALGLNRRNHYEIFSQSLAEAYSKNENPDLISLPDGISENRSPIFQI